MTAAGPPTRRCRTPRTAREAIQLLGDQLDEAAALNGWTAAELRRVLSTDSTAWVDSDGRVYYKDRRRDRRRARGGRPRWRRSRSATPSSCTARPARRQTLFIDFDGTNVVRHLLERPQDGVPDGNYPAWTPRR